MRRIWSCDGRCCAISEPLGGLPHAAGALACVCTVNMVQFTLTLRLAFADTAGMHVGRGLGVCVYVAQTERMLQYLCRYMNVHISEIPASRLGLSRMCGLENGGVARGVANNERV